ncbi:MAG TPA: trigger factor [Lentisphaeria bacterium]|nr:trigger factor [Lentisphaeria bacterium]|tara:strand:- start:1455 stop:2780 length:1326 start_codon:yes stop_codon:yes gene_type:complete
MATVDTSNIEQTTSEIEPCRYAVKFDVPATEVNHALKVLINKYRSAKIPGFRPGKTPAKLVRRRFKKQIFEETRDSIIRETIQSMLQDDSLNAVTMPELTSDELSDIADDTEFSFSVQFDVRPEMEPPELHGIKVAAPKIEVSEVDVADYLDAMCQQQARLERVERPAEENDILKVSYTSQTSTDEEVPATAQNLVENSETWIRLTEPTDIPGLVSALTNKSGGDKTDVTVTFPDDFREEFLAAKTVLYSINVHEIHALLPPEINDELAQKMGLDDVDALKDAVRSQIESTQRQQRQREIVDQIGKYLIKASDFPLPPTVLREEINRVMYERLSQQQQDEPQSGEPIEKKLDAMGEQAEAEARERLALRYMLQTIAAKEEIEPDKERMKQHLQLMTMQAQQRQREINPYMAQEAAAANATSDAVFERLTEWAEVTEMDRDN